MSRQTLLSRIAIATVGVFCALTFDRRPEVSAAGPTLVDHNLELRTVATGLNTPTSFAFIGPTMCSCWRKQTGRVIRVQGNVQTTVLDLAVNNGSERGLLGIALHPNFPGDAACVPVLDGKFDRSRTPAF